jgi:hypothetical protein
LDEISFFADGCLAKLKERFTGQADSSEVAKKDLLDFDEAYEKQLSWLMEKDKLAALLVPVGCDLSVIGEQLQQTQVSIHWVSTLHCMQEYVLMA